MAAHALSSSLLIPQLSNSQKPHSTSSSSSLSLPLTSSFHGRKLLHITHSSFNLKCSRTNISTVSSSLPTKKHSGDKLPKWSARGIRSFGLGKLEARKIKYLNFGTEGLLMGILVEGTSPAAKFLRANGITFFKVREEALNLLGKSDLYIFSPENLPLTEQAQRALDWAVDEKLKSGDSGEVTTTHLLLGIWSEVESAGHKILERLGFNDDKAKELAEAENHDPSIRLEPKNEILESILFRLQNTATSRR